MVQKIIIDRKYYGSVELAQTRFAKKIFYNVKHAFAGKKEMGLHLLFPAQKIKALQQAYQKGGSRRELEELGMYIEMGRILCFDTSDALRLKERIELLNDMAHNHFNLARRMSLINRGQPLKTGQVHLFWDIENFSEVAPVFNDLIDPLDIPDEHIYIAANPDSLYLKKKQWDNDMFDYGKNLYSFNFTKCDHGKNVADGVLLENFKALAPVNSTVYLITYDRELKELFEAACPEGNNLYILGK